MHNAFMSEPHERLQQARKAKFATAEAAAEAMGINPQTYHGHENGNRGLSRAAGRYAAFFRVSLDWLVNNKGPMKPVRAPRTGDDPDTVQLVGYVGAGAETHYFGQDSPLDDVPAIPGMSDDTVAVEIRGESLGTFFDRWLVYYDRVERPVSADQVNRLCVVGLSDGRILIKKIQRSRAKGLFHLLSQTEPPILDVEIEWAARVKAMVPR